MNTAHGNILIQGNVYSVAPPFYVAYFRLKAARVFLNEVLMPGKFDSHGDLVGEMCSMLNVLESFFLKDNLFLAGTIIFCPMINKITNHISCQFYVEYYK